jgi:hypothetical protein
MAYVTLAAAAVLLVLVGYWRLYPYDPLTVHKVTLMQKTVKQGEILPIVLVYTKRYDLPGMGTRSFIDGLVFTTQPTPGRLMTGTRSVIREVAIPTTLPPGLYYLHNEVIFTMTPLDREIVEKWNSPRFTVMPRDAHPDAEQDELDNR